MVNEGMQLDCWTRTFFLGSASTPRIEVSDRDWMILDAIFHVARALHADICRLKHFLPESDRSEHR